MHVNSVMIHYAPTLANRGRSREMMKAYYILIKVCAKGVDAALRNAPSIRFYCRKAGNFVRLKLKMEA
jgi:hypothetical protein